MDAVPLFHGAGEVRVFVIGKVRHITHWLEHAVAGLRSAGHEVRTAAVRNPALHRSIDAALADRRLGAPMARGIAGAVRRWRPDLVMVVGVYQAPLAVLERLSALAGRPPLVAWIGDAFGEEAAAAAGLFDLVAYTDSGLLARHRELGFASRAIWLPHAVDPSRLSEAGAGPRGPMAFVAVPTPHRRAVVAGLARPIALWGPGWTASPDVEHKIHARRIAPAAVRRVYAGALAVLNVRNEGQVIDGLNQRSFEPYLAGTAVVSDNQPDLERCFEPGAEVFVWRDVDELNAVHERLIAEPGLAASVAAAGRRRVLAERRTGQGWRR